MSGPVYSDLQTWGLLKELYDDDVRFQEHVQTSLYNFCDHASKDEVEYDGANFNVPLQFELNESYAMINDGERLPQAGFPKGVFAKYAVKLAYSTLEPSTFAATRGHRNGRPNGKYLDDYVKGTLLSMMSNMDFDLYANGRGFRATVLAATPSASSFTVEFSTRLRPGMLLDWYDSTMTTKRGSIKIPTKGIDRINRTVYVDATFGSASVPTGATAGDVLVVYGALDAGEPTDGRYVAGFDRVLDATVSLGSVSAANYAAWAPTNLNAAGANPSQELLQTFWDWLYTISGMYPNRMVFNPAWKRAYMAQFLSQRRFNSNVFDTGASSMTFSPLKMGTDEKNKKPSEFKMLEDKNADPEQVLVWYSAAIKCASDYADTPHLADEDGEEFRMKLGYDVMQGFFRYWWNTVTYQRNAMGKIYGFATPSNVI